MVARSSALRFLERERLVVLVLASFGVLVLLALPLLLVADSWLALVAGRSVAHHGLRATDTLTIYTLGEDWVDQQWLSQLALFGLHELGGMRLLLLVFAAVVIAALVLAMAAARCADASPMAVALVAFPALASYLQLALPVRTQAFALVLFVCVLWLLVEDARSPSRRVFWVLPLLVLWANLHGSVLLGAGIVVLRSGCAVVAARRGHGIALVLAAGAVVAIFATPYALDIPHYYASIMFNPGFAGRIVEWQRTTLDALSAPFYVLLLVAVGLLARYPSSVTTYEKLVLLATGVMGLMAVRNIVWFALAAIVILPAAVQHRLPTTGKSTSRLALLPIAYGPLLCLVVVLIVTVARPSSWFEPPYPAGAADAVARTTTGDPGARVFADMRYADWLMWTHPSLEGRVAFDARLEMLTSRQMTGIFRFLSQRTDGWRDAVTGYRVVVVARRGDLAGAATYRELLKEPGSRLAYLDAEAAVVVRAG
jgi:hypothetical protein